MNTLTQGLRYYILFKAKARLWKTRYKSKQLCLKCDLDEEWLLSKYRNGYCEITGVPFEMSPDKKRDPLMPSIDRIEPIEFKQNKVFDSMILSPLRLPISPLRHLDAFIVKSYVLVNKFV